MIIVYGKKIVFLSYLAGEFTQVITERWTDHDTPNCHVCNTCHENWIRILVCKQL